MSYISNEFYCINCGERGIDIARNRGHQHKAGHLKKLYCIHCRKVCNHYECPTPKDVERFKKKFAAGDFVELAKESIELAEKEWF